MDRRDKLLSHFLSQANRKDLIQLDGDEAIFQYLTALLNPRTPLKLNDSRPRWAKRVEMRYSEQPPQLDIICFTFALRHFSPDFIEILNHGVPQKALLLIQRTIASIIRANKAFMAQDGSSVLKVLPWGDIAQYVSQSDWKLGSKFLDEVQRDWETLQEFYWNFERQPPSNQPNLPSFDELITKIGQSSS